MPCQLSALLREAEAANGIVIRPAPVHRIGPDKRGDADMARYGHRLCDMHGLLKALADLNVIDEETVKSAKNYFNLQDKAWPASVTLRIPHTLFSWTAYRSFICSIPAFCRLSSVRFQPSMFMFRRKKRRMSLSSMT
jgi:hypothetical protein